MKDVPESKPFLVGAIKKFSTINFYFVLRLLCELLKIYWKKECPKISKGHSILGEKFASW